MARPRPVAFDPGTLPPPPSDLLLRINWSSGTTGTPKGTPLLRSRIVERLGVMLMVRPYSHQTRHLMAMGMSTTYGAMNPLCVLVVGGAVALPTPALEIVGTGYRVAAKGSDLEFQLGFSHPVVVPAPDGISFAVESPVKFKVIGIDKQKVGEVAANIRKIRKPEPYKGKGVRYEGEVIRRKAGKAGKK